MRFWLLLVVLGALTGCGVAYAADTIAIPTDPASVTWPVALIAVAGILRGWPGPTITIRLEQPHLSVKVELDDKEKPS